MQIAGSKCTVCGGSIVVAKEGKYCAQCNLVVHLTCEANDRCGVCGEPYRAYEAPLSNPEQDAYLPPSLRPAGSGAPTLAVVLVLLLTFLVIYLFEFVLGRDH